MNNQPATPTTKPKTKPNRMKDSQKPLRLKNQRLLLFFRFDF